MLRQGIRAGRGFGGDQRGATAVEFALVSPLLIFALLSIVEIGVLGMMSSNLDNAVVEVARRIRVGRADAPVSATDFKTQVCTQMGGDQSACLGRLAISVQKYAQFQNAGAAVDDPPANQFDRGAAGDIVIVKANYDWSLMTPFVATAFHRNGPLSVTLGARFTFKNEPYQ